MSTSDDHEFEAALAALNSATYQQDLMPISMLALVPTRIGDTWSVMWGEISGVGNTPIQAIEAFNLALYRPDGKYINGVRNHQS